MGARRIAMVTPYVPALTQIVADYIEGAGIEVVDSVSLSVDNNLEVGRLDPQQLPGIAQELNREGVDAVILSACVQMPSLAAVQTAEDQLGVPVITAAVATTYEILKALGHTPAIPGAGRLLAGDLVPAKK
jgi:maleate isomerase